MDKIDSAVDIIIASLLGAWRTPFPTSLKSGMAL